MHILIIIVTSSIPLILYYRLYIIYIYIFILSYIIYYNRGSRCHFVSSHFGSSQVSSRFYFVCGAFVLVAVAVAVGLWRWAEAVAVDLFGPRWVCGGGLRRWQWIYLAEALDVIFRIYAKSAAHVFRSHFGSSFTWGQRQCLQAMMMPRALPRARVPPRLQQSWKRHPRPK